MRILFIHNTLPAYRLVFFENLAKLDDIHFVFTEINKSKEIYGTNINFGEIDKKNITLLSKNNVKNIGMLRKLLTKEIDVVVIPPLDNFRAILYAIFVLLFSKTNRIKTTYFWEKWEAPKQNQPLKKRFKNNIQRLVCWPILIQIDHFIASGTKSKEYFESYGISSDKIDIAYDASELDIGETKYNIREKLKISDEKKIILYYGRLISRKGIKILLRALSRINNNDYFLVVCGDGPERKSAEELAKDLGLKNYSFLGAIHPEDSYIFFSQTNLFILPSFFENGISEAWGLTINEAIQFGKPVISTTAVGSAYDLIINNSNGFQVEQNNVEELKLAIQSYLDDPNRFDNKSYRIFEKINYANMAEQFRIIFEKV